MTDPISAFKAQQAAYAKLSAGKIDAAPLSAAQPSKISHIAGLEKMPGYDPSKTREQAATDFEALLLQDMLKSMWQTAPSSGLLSGSREEETYRGMLNEAIAKSIAQNKSLGIRDVIMKEFERSPKEMSGIEDSGDELRQRSSAGGRPPGRDND